MQQVDQIIKSCKQQNKKAQKQLYMLLLPYLRAVAQRYLRDPSFVQDALQESFVKVFMGINQYDPYKAPIKQWAARITINVCLNYNKRVIGLPKEELITVQHDSAIDPSIINDMTNEDVLKILKGMPAKNFEVFNLYVIDGFEHSEVAELLGISEEASRKRLSRARQWLKKTFTNTPNTFLKLRI